MKTEIFLDNIKYFEIFIGKRILKESVFNSKGTIPAYSANVFTPFGFVETSNITDFTKDYLLWGIDGNFEFNIMKKGTVFATTDHCGAIKILDENILSEYILYSLEIQKYVLGFDRTLRSSLTNMTVVAIKIPFKEGKPDKEAQAQMIREYIEIKNFKDEIQSETNALAEITLDVELKKQECLILKVRDIFDLEQTTNHSFFTKAFVDEHKGTIPVYSASKDPDETNYGFVEDNLPKIKYFENIFTWNIDGSVGKAFFRKGKFTLSEKVIPLILQNKWADKIDPFYVKYVLEKKAVEAGFAFSNKAGKERIADIEIEIPSKKVNGIITPDFEHQKKLASKYVQVYDLKDKTIQLLQELSKIAVEV